MAPAAALPDALARERAADRRLRRDRDRGDAGAAARRPRSRPAGSARSWRSESRVMLAAALHPAARRCSRCSASASSGPAAAPSRGRADRRWARVAGLVRRRSRAIVALVSVALLVLVARQPRHHGTIGFGQGETRSTNSSRGTEVLERTLPARGRLAADRGRPDRPGRGRRSAAWRSSGSVKLAVPVPPSAISTEAAIVDRPARQPLLGGSRRRGRGDPRTPARGGAERPARRHPGRELRHRADQLARHEADRPAGAGASSA